MKPNETDFLYEIESLGPRFGAGVNAKFSGPSVLSYSTPSIDIDVPEQPEDDNSTVSSKIDEALCNIRPEERKDSVTYHGCML